MQNLIHTANAVAPVFLIVLLGVLLRRAKLIDDNFTTVTTKLVFNVALPALVFVKVAATDFHQVVNPGQIAYVCAGTLFAFGFSWLMAMPFIKQGRDLGVFVQGSFRSNYGVVGLAISFNLFGESAMGMAALLLAFIVPMYNLLAVIALTIPMRHERQMHWNTTMIDILTNPLILALLVALPFAYFQIGLGSMVLTTGNYLAALALPLALIGIGGSLNFAGMRRAFNIAVSSALMKLIFIPLILTVVACQLGFEGEVLGVMFILFACPTAIASFIMAEAMGANRELAGNIVLLTNLGSVATITAGVSILKNMGLV
jgi:hypothetical protein